VTAALPIYPMLGDPPTPSITSPPQGCICPPGANHECRATACPRQPLPSVASQAAMPGPPVTVPVSATTAGSRDATIRSAPTLLSKLRLFRDRHPACDTPLVQELVQAAIAQIAKADMALTHCYEHATAAIAFFERHDAAPGSATRRGGAAHVRDICWDALSSDEARRKTQGATR
jgi:hypothetical protein